VVANGKQPTPVPGSILPSSTAQVFFTILITLELVASARSRGQDEFKALWGKVSIIFAKQ